jgi:hypothetical protein
MTLRQGDFKIKPAQLKINQTPIKNGLLNKNNRIMKENRVVLGVCIFFQNIRKNLEILKFFQEKFGKLEEMVRLKFIE